MSSAVVTGAAQAYPATREQEQLWDGFFSNHYAGSRLAKRIFASSGVHTRHGVVNPLDEDISAWGTGARMERYSAEAMPLGKEAVGAALDRAGLDPGDVGLFAVASCTGYTTPGIDIMLASDLGMSAGLQRLLVGHMGCYAAIPGLGAVSDFVMARARPAVLLCLELPSLHVQAPTDDVDQVVAHALFSDAAAAVVVQPAAPAGLELVDVVARTDASTADHMTWDVTDLGFRMGLSPRVPDVLAEHVVSVIESLLARHSLRPADIASWAVHPGGPRILDVVGERLALPADALDASRATLRKHGNCSSATVLLVLEELQQTRPPGPGGYLVAMAFGPGLTLYAALLRAIS
ncbi:MAG: type III polyketide synthase [Actinomycetota bacterium]|nr:type III polyketide synthase [Actinomycetota bacterium]